jgi:hypothetical protein
LKSEPDIYKYNTMTLSEDLPDRLEDVPYSHQRLEDVPYSLQRLEDVPYSHQRLEDVLLSPYPRSHPISYLTSEQYW